MDRLHETFKVAHILKLVVAAIAVGLLVGLAQFVLQRAGAPISKNASLLLGIGVMTFLLVTDSVNDAQTAITYAAVLVAGFTASRLATSFIK